jgi:lysozyme family protein
MSLQQAIALTVSPTVEGAFGKVASDCGNWTGGAVGAGECLGTFEGISAAFLWSLPPSDPYYRRDPATLTPADVPLIYKPHFWDVIAGDHLPPPIAGLLFDAAVNQGEGWAPKALQSAVGAATDGVLGPKTLAAVKAADSATLHATIGWLREARYRQDEDFGTFGHGWIVRLCRVIAATAAFT